MTASTMPTSINGPFETVGFSRNIHCILARYKYTYILHDVNRATLWVKQNPIKAPQNRIVMDPTPNGHQVESGVLLILRLLSCMSFHDLSATSSRSKLTFTLLIRLMVSL